MSRKHVEDYFNQITLDYHEMIETLKDMEEAVEQKMLSPDKLDQTKELVNKMKENYLRISYIMFLLNKPNKKEKEKKYNKQFSKKDFGNNDLKSIREENKQLINQISSLNK